MKITAGCLNVVLGMGGLLWLFDEFFSGHLVRESGAFPRGVIGMVG